MKNVWIAIALLLFAIGSTVGNSLFITHEIHSLSENTVYGDAVDVSRRFESVEPYLALTVNHVVLEQAQTAALEMAVYEHRNTADYLAARERFLAALREIEEGEKFSISNIF